MQTFMFGHMSKITMGRNKEDKTEDLLNQN